MLVCITGDGFVSPEASGDLLEDMLGSFTVEFMMPSHLAHTGQRNVAACLQSSASSWSLSRVPLGNLLDSFTGSTDPDKYMIVLDYETVPQAAIVGWTSGKGVLDLSRGLWPVTAS